MVGSAAWESGMGIVIETAFALQGQGPFEVALAKVGSGSWWRLTTTT